MRSWNRSKYGNEKVVLDGITFDSKKESRRYAELKLLEKAGEISNLMMQVPFELQPKFRNEVTGKIEHAIKYYADFTYLTKDGETVIEDVKSEATRKNDVYQIKRKMMAYHGWYITEV